MRGAPPSTGLSQAKRLHVYHRREMKGFVEREVKLEPGERFALPDLPGVPLLPRLFVSTYHDTPSHSLARHGITLRCRVDEAGARWQLKLPRDDGRSEIEAAGPADVLPDELAALLPVHLRDGALGPVASLRTTRSGVRVKDEGRELADVTIDVVEVLGDDGGAGGFTELEIELVDGDRSDLDRLVQALVAAGAERADERPKLFRVLDVPGTPTPAADAPAGELLRHLLARQLHELEAQDPGVRFGDDPEAVHRFRVATRRARALIRAAREIAGDELTPLAGGLAWLTRALGPVRDLDVLLEHLQAEVASLGPDRPGGEHLVAQLELERTTARGALIDALSDARYPALLDTFGASVDALEVPADSPTLHDLAARAFEKLEVAVRTLPADCSDDELHRIRIVGKRARYAAELAALRGDPRVAKFVSSVKTLQDVVGEHQDAVVAEERIRHLDVRAGSALAAGRLIERERGRRAAMRAGYPAAAAKVLRLGSEAFS